MKLDSHARARAATALIAAAVLSLSLGGCAAGQSQSAATGAADPIPQRIDQAREAFRQAAKDGEAVGAMMLVRFGDEQFVESYGSSVDKEDVAPTEDTIFRIGSNTKTFTGTIILQLVDEGALALDDPVSTYWPGVPGGDDITIAMALNMRSGLFNYTDSEQFGEQMWSNPAAVHTPEDILAEAFSHPVNFPPDTDISYSNTNTVLLGAIAEKVTGKPLHQLFKERLIEPLGLTHTALPAPDDVSLPSPYAHGYAAADDGTMGLVDVTDFNPSWAYAAGAAYSTANELAAG